MINLVLALLASIFLKIPASQALQAIAKPERVLATHEFSMADRYGNSFVNDVFRDNMLLTLKFLQGGKPVSPITWEEVNKPFTYELELKPDQVFAFHDTLLPEYQTKSVVTTNAHFNAQEGFKSDGWLYGDGVCQLASLVNWVARDAGLAVEAKVDHDFANIPDVPKEYGVAIYALQSNPASSMAQNLYITNNKDKPVKLVFNYDGEKLQVAAKEKL